MSNDTTQFILARIAHLEGQNRYFAAHPDKRSSSRDRSRAQSLQAYREELARRVAK